MRIKNEDFKKLNVSTLNLKIKYIYICCTILLNPA